MVYSWLEDVGGGAACVAALREPGAERAWVRGVSRARPLRCGLLASGRTARPTNATRISLCASIYDFIWHFTFLLCVWAARLMCSGVSLMLPKDPKLQICMRYFFYSPSAFWFAPSTKTTNTSPKGAKKEQPTII